jgi:hypothetical protein
MVNVERETCSFCDSQAVVAVPKPTADKVSICEPCALWALKEFEKVRALYDTARDIGR